MRVERLTPDDTPDAPPGSPPGPLQDPPAAIARRLRRLVWGGDYAEEEVVLEILAVVENEGDQAVLEYTREFDTHGADPRPLVVRAEELDEAIKLLPLEVVAGLQVAIANVAQVAHAGVGEDVSIELPQGQLVTVRDIPVASAAVYVPGGRAPYPSTVVMGVVTARAAGVLDVVVCSPPHATGRSTPRSWARVACWASSGSTAWAAPRRSPRSPTEPRPSSPSR